MAPPLRVGLFPYLNVQPLIFGLSSEPDFEIVLDVPSRIADRFRLGELDLAMVPSLEAATLDSPVLESTCIASDGAVETVMLHHRVPLERVTTLSTDSASRTSAVLAKILIAEASGHVPQSSEFSKASAEPPDADAILVIGDPAFNFARSGFLGLDMGRHWQERRSLPFVYAVMVVGPRAAQSGMAARIDQAKKRGLLDASTIARSYTSGVDSARAEHYLRNVIRYDLGQREKEGLALFYQLARSHALLGPRAKELEFHAF